MFSELLTSATGPKQFSDVQASSMITTALKTFQKKALAMMIEKESGKLQGEGAEFATVWEVIQDGTSSEPIYRNTVTKRQDVDRPKAAQLCLGGLLADEMGLGKTLTTLALIAGTVERTRSLNQDGHPTLIITPLSVITTWKDQIAQHLKTGSIRYTTYHGQRAADATALKRFDIVLTTYGVVSIDSSSRTGQKSKRAGLLQSIPWHRIVLDEAHVVRNRSSQYHRAVIELNARHRWCLTGTPIQNRVEDMGAIVEFLRVHPFDTPSEFNRLFVLPIERGTLEGRERLRLLVKAISLRRTKDAVYDEIRLPPCERIDQEVELNSEERTIYDLLKRACILAMGPSGSTTRAFQAILRLRQVCNHGRDLLPMAIRGWLAKISLDSKDPIPPARFCENCEEVVPNDEATSSQSLQWLPCFHQICASCQNATLTDGERTSDLCPMCSMSGTAATGHVRKLEAEQTPTAVDYCPSSKVEALLRNLDGDRRAHLSDPGGVPMKSIIFSEWNGMLDLTEKALNLRKFSFERVDGRKSLKQREQALNTFRNDPSCSVLLATLACASEGINLTVANRVHLLEPGWNPMRERQALDRVHRLGQTRTVVTVRYFVAGPDSIEELIRRRQEWKLQLASSSLADSSTGHLDQTFLILEDLKSALQQCEK
ncbi:hypothetical protein FALCPG4_010049 [Fusarium falciforme]